MRWTKKVYKEPRQGDIRIKSGFLLFPKTISGDARWLEYAQWKEIRSSKLVPIRNGITTAAYWKPVEWMSQ